MSVIETAKRNGLNVFGYLSYLMLVLPSWGKTPSEEQLDSIMPWSAALPETCHRTYHQIWNCQEICSRRIPKILDMQKSGSVVSQPS